MPRKGAEQGGRRTIRMAAAQCRSTKCTAERKGCRRELDSWRHKLIHCIGFESILEGMYGPMLLRDLNIFDDCEPEEVDDWSVEASCSHCSFCNLPVDKLGDHIAAASSPLSSPSDYSPCQVSSLSESSQSAHRFLQAVFYKKDVPLGCDSNIPLVAQELMKKMIHQFAIEYASKSHAHTTTNGLANDTPGSSPGSPSNMADSEAPLDLTLSRHKDGEPQPDGVLDLSRRNSCTATSSQANHKAPGMPPLKEELRDPVSQETPNGQFNGNTALEAVLRSLCPAHRGLLSQILTMARQERVPSVPRGRQIHLNDSHCRLHSVLTPDNIASAPFTFGHCKSRGSSPHYALVDCEHHSNALYHPADSKSKYNTHPYRFSDCKSKAPQGSSCCCVQRCSMAAYPVFCLKSLHCISCQSLAVSQIGNVCSFASTSPLSSNLCSSSSLCSASAIRCGHHSPHPPTTSCFSNHTCLAQVRHSREGGGRDEDPSCPVLKREQSPSPPPLSPIPSDINTEIEEKPPCLLHHTHEGNVSSLPVKVNHYLMDASQMEVDADTVTDEERGCALPSHRSGKIPSGTLLKDVVDRFSEKLDTIAPLEKDTPLNSSAIPSREKEGPVTSSVNETLQVNAHLSEIITTVLHTGCDSDYNLNELLSRHDVNEAKSPNTRYRRRQEVLAAITTPPDHASTRRHTLQIKRELAMLAAKSTPAKRVRVNDSGNVPSPSSSSSDITPLKEDAVGMVNHVGHKHHIGQTTEENGMKYDTDEERIITGGIEIKHATLADNKIDTDFKSGEGLDFTETELFRVEPGIELKDKGVGVKVKDEIQSLVITEETIKVEEREIEIATKESTDIPTDLLTHIDGKSCDKYDGCHIEHDGNQQDALSDGGSTPAGEMVSHKSVRMRRTSLELSNTIESTRSRRNIVPPKRFSSYVTEPRKMCFVACFSERIFNQRTTKDIVKPATLDAFSVSDGNTTQFDSISTESTRKVDFQSIPKEQSVTSSSVSNDLNQGTLVSEANKTLNHSVKIRTSFREGTASPVSKLQDAESHNPTMADVVGCDSDVALSLHNSQAQYISPIKLMYASPVKDDQGLKYSLKSATYGVGGEVVQELFDPCEESSWGLTLENNKTPCTETTSSPVTLVSSPPKAAGLSPRSSLTQSKLTSSPYKSASSSPKVGTRRSGDGISPRRANGSANQKSTGDCVSFHETSPKRRPGRPKKLGPQLEKIKRPIGRPRKQKVVEPVREANAEKDVVRPNIDNANKNLKVTVVYGRSRRNKRLVSEDFSKLQMELHEVQQAVDQEKDLNHLLQKSCSDSLKPISTEWSEELNLVRPVKDKEYAPHSSRNITCQKLHGDVAIRKPGRPAKVKISGISVTVTNVSPRQRKIQLSRDTRQSSETFRRKRELLPEFKSAKDSRAISLRASNDCSQAGGQLEAKEEGTDKEAVGPVAVRHSVRVRKPSIYLLHSVATSTSRSYSHSTALLRRSKQLLLTKASNQRKQEEYQGGGETTNEKRKPNRHVKTPNCQDLRQVAGVSVNSIFPPTETMRWWSASAEQNIFNQELARRIRLISDTWVSNAVENQEEARFKPKLGTKSSFIKRSRPSSMVQMLFDCPPNNPSSCSMQQLCTWFMQTTETRSLAIVKKASSRNPYELMHYPRSSNKGSICPSPQAERLRKHIKKFAKTVPKSPSEHQWAQDRLRRKEKATLSNVKRQLFQLSARFPPGRLNKGAPWWRSRSLTKYSTTLLRARARFQSQKERMKWLKRESFTPRESKWTSAARSVNGHIITALQPRDKATDEVFDCSENTSTTKSTDNIQELVAVPKEHRLSSEAWSPEKLKECRVFLKKINSPDNESAADEEWDSCTVTLDVGSPPAYGSAGSAHEDKAVNTGRKNKRSACKDPISALNTVQLPVGNERGKLKRPGTVSTEPPQPPPVKMLRQSRVRGLTGPKWSDFIFDIKTNEPGSFSHPGEETAVKSGAFGHSADHTG